MDERANPIIKIWLGMWGARGDACNQAAFMSLVKQPGLKVTLGDETVQQIRRTLLVENNEQMHSNIGDSLY